MRKKNSARRDQIQARCVGVSYATTQQRQRLLASSGKMSYKRALARENTRDETCTTRCLDTFMSDQVGDDDEFRKFAGAG